MKKALKFYILISFSNILLKENYFIYNLLHILHIYKISL